MSNQSLTENKFSLPRDVCPVCKSKDIAVSQANLLEFCDNFYLDALCTDLNISKDDLKEYAVVHECSRCSTVFCDPWLKYEVASEIFNVVYGQHNRGWDALYGWLANKPVQSFRALLDLAIDYVGPISTYGEYMCPFMGNLMFYRDEELQKIDKNTLYDASISYITARHQNAKLSADRKNKSEILRERSKASLEKLQSLRKNKKEISIKRYLLHEASSLCWGHGCIGDGVNCKSLVGPLLAANILTTQEALGQNLKIDLIGVFNTLDHVTDPLGTLYDLLEISSAVLLINHAQPIISKQHNFVFRPGFLDYLRGQGLSVTDLTNKVQYSSTEINKDKIIALIQK